MKQRALPYAFLAGVMVLLVAIDAFAAPLLSFFSREADAALLVTFFTVSTVCVLSFLVFHLSAKTVIPSFVVAIFFGMIGKPLLAPIVEDRHILGTLVTFGATLILFSGGLETPYANFKKLFWKIASLSFPGLALSALLFSFVVQTFSILLGAPLSILSSLLLGAVLASTDPAAIIPVLKQLRFGNRATKDVIVSESAVTDVTGTLLTIVFLTLVSGGMAIQSIPRGYQTLFTEASVLLLGKQIIFGILFGMVGYGLLVLLGKLKERHGREYGADAAYFVFVPIVVFTLALAFGGSGYLAAFVAGLLFILTKYLHETEQFFNQMIEGFLKPLIFLLLGALVDVRVLFASAGIGILAALAFMLIVRPFAVFLTLGPFSLFEKDERLSWRELAFISFVRETGAIPAVLLITIASMGIPGTEAIVPIGMWVILGTLILQPPLTPVVARLLKVAEPIHDTTPLDVTGSVPFVVLGSRGVSYLERLPKVAEWAARHNIERIVLLHCLEDKYTPTLAAKIKEQAAREFEALNARRAEEGKPSLEFSYVSRTGFLQKNIDALARQDDKVAMIFVGRKILDYRLEQIKRMAVPFFFMD